MAALCGQRTWCVDPGAETVVPGDETAARWRLFDGSGTLLGLAEPRADGLLHPVLVLV